MTKAITRLFTLLLCASLSTLALAQHADHHVQNVPVIDGAKHPELIPDLVAYRLYLITVGELPSANQQATLRQNAHVAKIGLKHDDAGVVLKTANDFKQQYHALIDDYNAHLDPRRIDPVAYRTFMLKRDVLVSSAVSSLRQNLSQDGFARFSGHIQSEKRHMTTQ